MFILLSHHNGVNYDVTFVVLFQYNVWNYFLKGDSSTIGHNEFTELVNNLPSGIHVIVFSAAIKHIGGLNRLETSVTYDVKKATFSSEITAEKLKA